MFFLARVSNSPRERDSIVIVADFGWNPADSDRPRV